jgi:hypothetical protein
MFSDRPRQCGRGDKVAADDTTVGSTPSRRAMPAWKTPTGTGDAKRLSRVAVPLLPEPRNDSNYSNVLYRNYITYVRQYGGNRKGFVELISEHTRAGLAAARTSGRLGGRPRRSSSTCAVARCVPSCWASCQRSGPRSLK